jgi:hypothetical protein
MSAMTAKRQEIVGKDQDGRDVYADKSVVIPGSLRPDGTRRKDLRVRAEQRPDGSWRSFVPQDEVKKYEVRARRPADPPGAAGPPLPPPLFKREAPLAPVAETAEAAEAPAPAPAPAPAADAGDELRRRAKGLTKKLKAVSELEARVTAGLVPNAQQAEKLARRGELEKDLAAAMEALAVT